MGRLVRRTLKADELLAEWSPGDRGSYDAAAAVLRGELEAGNAAVRVEGVEHEAVTTLPEDAELVVVTTAMGGG